MTIDFEPCRIAGGQGAEDGRIARANGVILALLVSAAEASEPERWYLLQGFGPCPQEGLLFSTLEDAAAWIRESLSQELVLH